MRLNVFLPATRGRGARAAGTARAVRLLRKLGPSWAASPVRRLAQTVSFLLFLALLLYVCWPYGATHYASFLEQKEFLEAETFLALDPLVSVTTAIAARTWVWSLTWAGVLLLVCLLLPRGFCGYLCPMGTLIDLFDWAVGRRVVRFRTERRGWWVNLKYYLLAGTLASSAFGVLLSGFVAAIPLVTRGLLFVVQPLQIGLLKGWYLVPPLNAGQVMSLVLFGIVLGLGFLQPRFWCKHVCPTGAVFSVASLLRITERRVATSCIDCGKCQKSCPFDAIKDDFTTRPLNCTFCQTCGGVCPTQSIQFVGRWSPTERKAEATPPPLEVDVRKRGLLLGGVAGLGAAACIEGLWGADLDNKHAAVLVRPPGSVPEREFLQRCIRCGECFQVCPNNVLQPVSFQQGIEGLWTPQVVASWSGCEPSCNNCGQVCPTGAIRALPLEEKRAARIGLAVVNKQTCLPFAGREACQLCVDDCAAAGYDALEFVRVGAELDKDGVPVEGTGYLAPVVLPEKCNGCGLCETRCHQVNVKEKRLLAETAVRVKAGPGNEDRMRTGSYLELRERERKQRDEELQRRLQEAGATDEYLPDFLK